MFLTGTLSFHSSKPIRPGDNMLVSIDTIKSFIGKIGEKYSFKKKSSKKENPKSPETTINKLMPSPLSD